MPIRARTSPALMPKNQCNWNRVFFNTSLALFVRMIDHGAHYAAAGCRETFFFTHKSPIHRGERGQLQPLPCCRSELARDDHQNNAGHQFPRVIVDDHREQVRSYMDRVALVGASSLAMNPRTPRGTSFPASSLTTIANRDRVALVGASMLAMNPRTPRGTRLPASSLTTIASELAPTGGRFSHLHQKWKLVLSNAVRPAAWLAKWVEKALS